MTKKAFTLLELLIVMTIASILMMMVYAPYNYYTNKAKVKLTGKEISQILASSRNMAIHGADSSGSIDSFSGKNIDVLVNFSSGSKTVDVYNFAFDDNATDLFSTGTAVSVKKYDLQQGMQIDTDANFRFEAITGSGKYDFSDIKKVIQYSFKGSPDLAGELTYYTLTNISDY